MIARGFLQLYLGRRYLILFTFEKVEERLVSCVNSFRCSRRSNGQTMDGFFVDGFLDFEEGVEYEVS